MIVFWRERSLAAREVSGYKKYRPQSYKCERYLGIFFCKLNIYELRQSFIAFSLSDVKPDTPTLPDSAFDSPDIHPHSIHSR